MLHALRRMVLARESGEEGPMGGGWERVEGGSANWRGEGE